MRVLLAISIEFNRLTSSLLKKQLQVIQPQPCPLQDNSSLPGNPWCAEIFDWTRLQ
jgi:hypothetical protein